MIIPGRTWDKLLFPLAREVRRVYRWGTAFVGDGYGLHAENVGSHQGL